MLRIAIMALVSGLITIAAENPAQAGAYCGDRAQIVEKLEEVHKEKRESIGMLPDGGLLEVLVSPTGNWTILVSYPKRPSCIVAAGKGWQGQIRLSGEPT